MIHFVVFFQAPPRAEVVKSLRNGIVVNLLGMGAAVLGMQATVGLLVAKALTTSAVPYYQAIPAGRSPVLALDVFLVQVRASYGSLLTPVRRPRARCGLSCASILMEHLNLMSI